MEKQQEINKIPFQNIDCMDIKASPNILDPEILYEVGNIYSYSTGELKKTSMDYNCCELINIQGHTDLYVSGTQFVYFDEERNFIAGGGCHKGFPDYWVEDFTIETDMVIHHIRVPENAFYVGFNFDTADSFSPIVSYELIDRAWEYGVSKYIGNDMFETLIRDIVSDYFKAGEDKVMIQAIEKIVDKSIAKKSSALDGKTIALLGDSISSASYVTPTYWQTIAEETGCSFLDYAIGGTTIAHSNRGTAIPDSERGNGYVDRYTSMDESADAVIVMGGTNDALRTPLGNWDDTGISTFYGALNTLLQGLIEKYAGKPIIFMIPIQSADLTDKQGVPPTIKDLDSCSAEDTLSLSYLRAAILAKCTQYGVKCIDMYKDSGINGRDTKHIYYRTKNDQLHPSARGIVRIANALVSELEKQFRYVAE